METNSAYLYFNFASLTLSVVSQALSWLSAGQSTGTVVVVSRRPSISATTMHLVPQAFGCGVDLPRQHLGERWLSRLDNTCIIEGRLSYERSNDNLDIIWGILRRLFER